MKFSPSSALCLALAETIPPDFQPAEAQGKDLDDETILRAELHSLVHTALNYRAGHTLDDTAYAKPSDSSFEYGCHRLNEIWHCAAIGTWSGTPSRSPNSSQGSCYLPLSARDSPNWSRSPPRAPAPITERYPNGAEFYHALVRLRDQTPL